MVYFFSFSFLLLFSFLLEQSILLPFGLSPGGFFVSFFIFLAGLFFLEREKGWWFAILGGIAAGVFSGIPLFSFLLFTGAGALFLLIKPVLPIERVFSYCAALWLGVALYLAVFSFVWGSAWLFGFSGMIVFSSFVSSLLSVAFFGLGALIPISIVWWLLVYRRRNTRRYILR